ncbi:hypothetical protein V5O48_014322 [Marasmius crinis-equi]|uniref:C2H2-type domain-containing protein n=1 Tax=Marasmius crinis-equi TaxID=585013 RepID=A0ABR3EXN6_9AGAR
MNQRLDLQPHQTSLRVFDCSDPKARLRFQVHSPGELDAPLLNIFHEKNMEDSRTCGGCTKVFDTWSLRRHLARTKEPECVRYANSLDSLIALDFPDNHGFSSEPEISPELSPNGFRYHNREQDPPADVLGDFDDFALDSPPRPFEGDFLGTNYTLQDLGQGEGGFSDEDAHDQEGGDWGTGREEAGDGGNDRDEDDDHADDLDDFDDDEINAMREDEWEPTRAGEEAEETEYGRDNGEDEDMEEPARPPTPTTRTRIEDRLRKFPEIVHFGGQAGQRLADGSREDADTRYKKALGEDVSLWHPFTSQTDWEVARWAKLRGPGSNAFNEFLKIPDVVEKLGLSFSTTQELNKIIDASLPGRPAFRRAEAVVAGEAFEFYHRDILECVKTLWGDPDLTSYLVFAPERHYTDTTLQTRLFHNMHTGKWWWATQEAVEEKHPGATIIPVIISSDKTQLTVFGSKTAYPVYISIGNIPKEIRRKPSRGAYLLLAYLPTSKLSHMKNKSARRRALANLFHACMSHITAPLKAAGLDGMRVEDGAGVARRGHPILAVYVADYPEQTLVTTAKGNRCPGLCPTDPDHLGDDHTNGPFLDLEKALEVFSAITDGPTAFMKKCKENGMKPIPDPFWKDLPHTNIFHSITPDILHQLYQGLIKRLIAWLIKIVGEAEIDARCRRFPPNHNIRLFMRGISGLSKVTGTEHDMISRFLLGLIIDIRLPGNGSPRRLCAAVRGMLDFVFLSQYPLHTTETLELLQEALSRFHAHKDVFVELGACSGFRIPKLHGCQHFPHHIENFGTTDNYNTEYTERLHIDLAKNAYRSTNHRDELPQMVLWLDRREKLHRHTKFINSRLSGTTALTLLSDIAPGVTFERTMKMTKHPTVKSVAFTKLISDYGALHFRDALARYITSIRAPHLTVRQLVQEAADLYIPFVRVPVWHRVKWTAPDLYSSKASGTVIVDSAHVNPARTNKRGHVVPGRFDTVLVKMVEDAHVQGIEGYRVGRVRVLFTLRKSHLDQLFQPDEQEEVPRHLAYIEWFTRFPSRPDPVHGLYKINHSVDSSSGYRDASVVPVAYFQRSVHLYPKFGPVVPPNWTSSTVLDDASVFYVNSFSDRHAYYTIY